MRTTNTLKLTKVGRARMLKLIEFLNQLTPRQFNFGRVVTYFDPNHPCNTVACPVGWMPAVFPKLVKWEDCEVQLVQSTAWLWFDEVASKVFHIPRSVAEQLFSPVEHLPKHFSWHRKLPICNASATPKRVAKKLLAFIVLADAGGIPL